MPSELSEEVLAIAEQVYRAAREQGNTPFTVYHGESHLPAESEPEGTAKERSTWQT